MPVEKRGKGRYRITIYRGMKPDGTQDRWRKTIRATKDAAEKLEREMQLRHDRSEDLESPGKKTTIKEVMEDYLEIVKKPTVKPRTYINYSELVKWYITPELGEIELKSLTTLRIQKHYHWMGEKRGLSPRQIRQTHTLLNGALKAATTWQMIPLNPAAGIKLPGRIKTIIRVFNSAEAQSFVKAALQTRYGLIFVFALDTGMRPEEYLGVAWTDLDLERDCPRVFVRRTVVRLRKNPEKKRWHFGEPKTAASRRSIDFSPELAELLLDYRERELKDRISLGLNPYDLVFSTVNGEPFIPENLAQRHFKPILRSVNLPDVRLYDLRHSCATLLLARGVPAKVVSERLGHTSVAFTLDTYTHVLPTMQAAASETMSTLLFRNPPECPNSAPTGNGRSARKLLKS
jgi:integrase